MRLITSFAIASLLFTATTALSVRIADTQELQASAPKPADSNSQKSIVPAKPADKNEGSLDPALANTYRIGVGDVLDIRLLSSRIPRSTLYTVLEGGMIDLPVAGGPIAVAGLTTDEIQILIAAELKRRDVEENARISVGVRQYASHSVSITGLVNNPGTKFLRREVVPLYVIMAEAQSRLDAGRAAIMRAGSEVVLDLADPASLNVLIKSGDLISVTARPQQFYYIGGLVNYPGQKTFQEGITLLQALLAAGGPSRKVDNVIELSREERPSQPSPEEEAGSISREYQGRRLITVRIKLRDIKSGKVPDPQLLPGDRIDVVK